MFRRSSSNCLVELAQVTCSSRKNFSMSSLLPPIILNSQMQLEELLWTYFSGNLQPQMSMNPCYCSHGFMFAPCLCCNPLSAYFSWDFVVKLYKRQCCNYALVSSPYLLAFYGLIREAGLTSAKFHLFSG